MEHKVDHIIGGRVRPLVVARRRKRLARNARKLLRQVKSMALDPDVEGDMQPFALCAKLGHLGMSAQPGVLGELLLVASKIATDRSLSSVALTKGTEEMVSEVLQEELIQHIEAAKLGDFAQSSLYSRWTESRACASERDSAEDRDANMDDDNNSDRPDTDSELSASDSEAQTTEDEEESEGESEEESEQASLEDTPHGDEADPSVMGAADILMALQMRFCDLLQLDHTRPWLWSCTVVTFIAQHPEISGLLDEAMRITLAPAHTLHSGDNAESASDAPGSMSEATVFDHLAAIAEDAMTNVDLRNYEEGGAPSVLTRLEHLERTLCEQLRVASFESLQLGSLLAFLVKNAEACPSVLRQHLQELWPQDKLQVGYSVDVDERNAFLRSIHHTACRFGLDATVEDAQAALALHYASTSTSSTSVTQKEWTTLKREWAQDRGNELAKPCTLSALAPLLVCKDSAAMPRPRLATNALQSVGVQCPISETECCKLLAAVPALADVGAALRWETCLAPYFGPLDGFLHSHAEEPLLAGHQFFHVSFGRWVRLPRPCSGIAGLLTSVEEGRSQKPVDCQSLALAVVVEVQEAGHLSTLPLGSLTRDIRTLYTLVQQQSGAFDEREVVQLAWKAFAYLPPPLQGKDTFELLLAPALRDNPGWDSRLPEVFTSVDDWVLFRKAAWALGNTSWQNRQLPATITAERSRTEISTHEKIQLSLHKSAKDVAAIVPASDNSVAQPRNKPSPTVAATSELPPFAETPSVVSRQFPTDVADLDAAVGGMSLEASPDTDAHPLSEKECCNLLAKIHRKFGQNLDASMHPDHLVPLQELRAYAGRTTKYLATELYAAQVHFLMELIQNADDCRYPADVSPSFEITLTDSSIELRTNEVQLKTFSCHQSCKLLLEIAISCLDPHL
jgi:hypothetical protein